jgi:MFS family permease
VAALIGPFVATSSSDFLGVEYAGAYAMVGVFALTSIPLMLSLRAGHVRPKIEAKPTPVPLSTVRGCRDFYAGLTALAGAGGLMTMIMAVGPLANHHAGHSAHLGAAIIQWHLTGAIGAALFAAGAICGVLGTGFVNFLLALALNGIGWNFLYLAVTTFIVRSYPAGRGGRIQAMAEGLGQFTGVLASFSASSVFVYLGWEGTNWPVLVISLGLMLWMLFVATRRPVIVSTVGAPGPIPTGIPRTQLKS